ncbi:DNA translocase FtsK [Patescibacteria group bacterium]|nr:DNA translocase FtsK [Patescibacteria group bacterium]
MAKKVQKRQRAKEPLPPRFSIPSVSLAVRAETLRSIYALLALIVALLFLLASVGYAGQLGDLIYEVLKETLFGFGYFLIPLSFAFMAIGLFRDREPSGVGGTRAFGAALLFASGIAILSVAGEYGGLVGGAIAYPFVALFDVIFGSIVLAAIALVGTLLALDTPLRFPRSTTEDDTTDASDVDADESDAPSDGVADEPEPRDEVPKVFTPFRRTEKKPEPIAQDDVPAAVGFQLSDVAYTPPPMSLLEREKGKPETGDIKANANIIKRTLQNFGITVDMDEVAIGPTVTRFALKPAEGVRLQKIVSLQNNLELALAASPIRIEAPIPGKSLVGIEVPNQKKATVALASLLSDDKFRTEKRPLFCALGRDIAGSPHYLNLAKMPHLLVAGATGSGKSVTIHTMISSLLFRNGPGTLRFIMIDPKRVELTLYNGIPHLLTPVITDPKKAILALKWAGKEMERRYNLLETHSVRDIGSYHENVVATWKPGDGDSEAPDQMPYIVIFIDELADIMQSYPRELEAAVVRLAQMSRAVGIHLVLSTQRPSVNVITGLIKANVPARIALQVASQIDSRTILDAPGAENLLGAGDMLFQSADMPKPHRIQTAFVSENEVKEVVSFIRSNNERAVDDIAITAQSNDASPNAIFSATLEDEGGDDDLFAEAKQTVEEAGRASTSLLQRKLRIGYSRAARLMDLLEEKGIIGPQDGARPREVLSSRPAETYDES